MTQPPNTENGRFCNVENIKDGQKIALFNSNFPNYTHFVVYDYDIRFFNNNNRRYFEINTYPNDPRDVLKLVYSFN